MKRIPSSERGQAIVLIVLSLVGLFALTGLAVDGGLAFSDRRNAQNAADTASLAAALAKVRDQAWNASALNRAASNGYTNDGVASTVEVYACDDPASSCPAAYNGNNNYVQVIITSHLKTFFSRVIGITQMTNKVQAVAHAEKPVTKTPYDGNAIVGLSPNDCKAVVYQGNANMLVNGGGIFVNSDCADAAFFNNSSAASLTAPSLNSVGGITYKPGALNITGDLNTGALPYPYPPDWIPPTPTCDFTWSGTFPPKGTTTIQPGVHCLSGDFVINANDTLTGTGVTFVVLTGEVRWNGGNGIDLSAPTTGVTKGLLIYLPITNTSPITMNGNASWNISGTILAPASDITVNGTEDGTALHSQIVGYTVSLSGNGVTQIDYDDNITWKATFSGQTGLTR